MVIDTLGAPGVEQWPWASARLRLGDADFERFSSEIRRVWEEFATDPGAYYLSCLGGFGQSKFAQETARYVRMASDFGSTKIFVYRADPGEVELIIASCAENFRREVEHRVHQVLDAARRARQPWWKRAGQLFFISGWREAPGVVPPVKIRFLPLARTFLSGKGLGFLAWLDLTIFTLVTSAVVMSSLALKFGDDDWPLAFAPVFSAIPTLAFVVGAGILNWVRRTWSWQPEV